MNNLFSSQELSLLIRLLIAHFVTDFLLQPAHWVEGKRLFSWKSKYLWYHGLLTGGFTWLLAFEWRAWWLVLVIAITHFVIDGLKSLISRNTPGSNHFDLLLFSFDQILHLLIIILSWLAYTSGWQKINTIVNEQLPDNNISLKILGYLIVIGPVGYIVHFVTRRWTQDLNLQDSLKDAGRWIGMLERVLIITFIYTNQFSAIGFLIAAKSVLRVTDKPEPHPAGTPFSTRKHTEYVLIGTFLSFAIAIITGLVVNRLSA